MLQTFCWSAVRSGSVSPNKTFAQVSEMGVVVSIPSNDKQGYSCIVSLLYWKEGSKERLTGWNAPLYQNIDARIPKM